MLASRAGSSPVAARCLAQVLEPRAAGRAAHHALPRVPARTRVGVRRGAAGALRGGADRGRPLALQDELRARRSRHRRAARREDAAQRAGRRARPDGRLPHREAGLREPARHPRDARSSTCPTAPPGRKPAVLVACGHSPTGQGVPAYQEIAGASRGAGTSSSAGTPSGQGERSQFWDARARPQPLQPRLRRARGARQPRDARRHEPRALHGLGRHARARLPARRATTWTRARIAITGTSGGGLPGHLDRRARPAHRAVLPSCFLTALPMRMANRIFEDPDSDPEQDPPGLVSEGVDHPGLLLLAYPRPLHVSAAVHDFFPIEGTRRTMREVAAVLPPLRPRRPRRAQRGLPQAPVLGREPGARPSRSSTAPSAGPSAPALASGEDAPSPRRCAARPRARCARTSPGARCWR